LLRSRHKDHEDQAGGTKASLILRARSVHKDDEDQAGGTKGPSHLDLARERRPPMLVATPVHFRRIERGSGVRATVSRITNSGPSPIEVAFARVRSPYWIDVGRKGQDGGFVP